MPALSSITKLVVAFTGVALAVTACVSLTHIPRASLSLGGLGTVNMSYVHLVYDIVLLVGGLMLVASPFVPSLANFSWAYGAPTTGFSMIVLGVMSFGVAGLLGFIVGIVAMAVGLFFVLLAMWYPEKLDQSYVPV
eukprot:m51a1_g7085 hypothetical protein (136) ;mRNA; r:14428-14914